MGAGAVMCKLASLRAQTECIKWPALTLLPLCCCGWPVPEFHHLYPRGAYIPEAEENDK